MGEWRFSKPSQYGLAFSQPRSLTASQLQSGHVHPHLCWANGFAELAGDAALFA